eukprot:89285-Chlamydomonas_euryale.AAC.4
MRSEKKPCQLGLHGQRFRQRQQNVPCTDGAGRLPSRHPDAKAVQLQYVWTFTAHFTDTLLPTAGDGATPV